MFRFIDRLRDKRNKKKKEIDNLVTSIINILNDTREDNITLCIPTKYFIEINDKLKGEHDLHLDYIRGNDNICEVNVCEYVDVYEIGEKIK